MAEERSKRREFLPLVLLPFKTDIQSFSPKSGQKCQLLCHLKDKGKRYSTLEAMLLKRQGKRRIETCFHLFLD